MSGLFVATETQQFFTGDIVDGTRSVVFHRDRIEDDHFVVVGVVGHQLKAQHPAVDQRHIAVKVVIFRQISLGIDAHPFIAEDHRPRTDNR